MMFLKVKNGGSAAARPGPRPVKVAIFKGIKKSKKPRFLLIASKLDGIARRKN